MVFIRNGYYDDGDASACEIIALGELCIFGFGLLAWMINPDIKRIVGNSSF